MPQIHELRPLDLYERLHRGDRLVILDVRNEDEFQAAPIEGRHAVPTVNIPYFDFIEDADAAIARMPFQTKDEIVVICAKGGSSDFVAGLLRERGYHAVNMTGGSLEWADFYAVREVVPATDALTILQFDRPGKASLSYLIGSRGEALVVDANRNIQPYMDVARERGLAIRHVLDTHVHADYISGGPALAEATGATYHLSGACGYQGAIGLDGAPGPLALGDRVATKLHTPGHTPGSTSLLIDGTYLFTGDTLFVSSVGRPDLGGHAEEWAKDLYETLYLRLRDLPDETVVLPAHYGTFAEMRPNGVVAGSLGDIRRENEGMQATNDAEFLAFIRANMRPSPESYATIRKINLSVLDLDPSKLVELDLGKNQCAASLAKLIQS